MNQNSNKDVEIISAEENLGLGSVGIAFSGNMNNPGSNSNSLQPLLPEAIPNPTFSTHQVSPENLKECKTQRFLIRPERDPFVKDVT